MHSPGLQAAFLKKPALAWQRLNCTLSCGINWLTVELGGRILLRLRGEAQLAAFADFLAASRTIPTLGKVLPPATITQADGSSVALRMENPLDVKAARLLIDDVACRLAINCHKQLSFWLKLILGRAQPATGFVVKRTAPGSVSVSIKNNGPITIDDPQATELATILLATAGDTGIHAWREVVLGHDCAVAVSSGDNRSLPQLVAVFHGEPVAREELTSVELVLLAGELLASVTQSDGPGGKD